MGSWRGAVAAMLLLLAGCGPQLGDLEPGEKGRVTAAFNGDGLELDSGLRVLLAEIDAPGRDQPFARAAQADLEALTLGREVRLAYGGQKRLPARQQREGAPASTEPPQETAIAHVFVKTEGGRWIWLQHELVAHGDAWVLPRRENEARAGDLFAVETQARAASIGLRAEADYQPRNPRAAAEEALALNVNCRRSDAPFRFVEGRIASAARQDARASLIFGPARADAPSLNVVVFGRGFSEWTGPSFESYAGKNVRVRGRLESFRPRDAAPDAPGQPQICVDHAGQIEILD